VLLYPTIWVIIPTSKDVEDDKGWKKENRSPTRNGRERDKASGEF
jgi:hypothetical protein